MLLNQILNPKPTAYSADIAEVTGAHRMELPIIERLMRDVIFHSTLDWQTKEQFEAGAREAYEIYQSAKGFYDAENKLLIYQFHHSKTEENLSAAVAKLDRATAKGVPERVFKCQAEVAKLRKKTAELAKKTEFWERVMRRMNELLA